VISLLEENSILGLTKNSELGSARFSFKDSQKWAFFLPEG
jgi:hypothetical protein